MQQPCYQNYIERMNKAGIRAPLVREFLEKGLRRAAIQSIDLKLSKLETQTTILRNITLS